MSNRWGIPKHVEEYVIKGDTSYVFCGISLINNNPTRKKTYLGAYNQQH